MREHERLFAARLRYIDEQDIEPERAFNLLEAEGFTGEVARMRQNLLEVRLLKAEGFAQGMTRSLNEHLEIAAMVDDVAHHPATWDVARESILVRLTVRSPYLARLVPPADATAPEIYKLRDRVVRDAANCEASVRAMADIRAGLQASSAPIATRSFRQALEALFVACRNEQQWWWICDYVRNDLGVPGAVVNEFTVRFPWRQGP
jgi:hypothetical protein